MIVGIDKNEKDMISHTEENGNIYDFTKSCPIHCPKESPLAV